MSTKIYNGYRLKGIGATLPELSVFTEKVKKAMIQRAKGLQDRFVAETVAHIIDSHSIGELYRIRYKKVAFSFDFNMSGNPIDIARKILILRQKNIETTNVRDREIDFKVDICFFEVEGHLLCLLFSDNDELTKVFETFCEVESFSYWNNSDRPKGVSSKEWKERSKLWDIALPGAGVPSETGFVREIIGKNAIGPSMKSDILPLIHPKKTRAREIAKKIILDLKIKELVSSDPELSSGGKDPGLSDLMSHYLTACEFLSTKDGKDMVRRKALEIEKRLINISAEDLSRKYTIKDPCSKPDVTNR